MAAFFISIILLMSVSARAADFLSLFSVKKPVIAAIMVPGEFANPKDFAKAQEWTLQQADLALAGGMDGLLVEFRGGGILDKNISPAQLQAMAAITRATITHAPGLVVGVEILWHFPGATLELAKASGARFVRIDFFVDRVVAQGAEVPIDPKAVIAFREKIGAKNVALLTDIQVKYSKMIDPKITIGQSAQAARTAGSDGVVISGAKSGSAPEAAKLLQTRKSVPQFPVVIGSGFSRENASQSLPYVDAVIVGTSISEKTGGPLLAEKISALMAFVREARSSL